MRTKRLRNVSRHGYIAHTEENACRYQSRKSGNRRKYACSSPDPNAFRSHRAAQQQRKRRVAGHRIILLRGGKRKENQNKTCPAYRQQPSAARTIDWFERKFRDSREIDAPGKQPHEVQQPEVKTRDRVVITRIP